MSEIIKDSENITDCIHFFKQCKISAVNKDMIKKKLAETTEIRKFMLLDKSIDIYDVFSLYFLDVEYV